ncbi:MAG: HK97 family phage prohead protease [Clostridiales bacterium]|uniref:HK97 family phage prohead protease n=1 Tax=Zhenhengia sp. TaxID=2944208 RepID=UPI0029089DCD|nr:HK97 family phage prohead protease [Clostridiales bacterium]
MQVEVRSDGKLEISGYVNAIDRYSKELYGSKGKFIEKVAPTVFQRALEKSRNVDMLLNHDVRRKLASIEEGTLELKEDTIGLHAKAVISDTEVIEEARCGNLKGWSFGFRALSDSWQDDAGVVKRTLEDIDLIEVSLLTIEPAYIATSVQVRSEDIEKRSVRDKPEIREWDAEVESERNLVTTKVWLFKNKIF